MSAAVAQRANGMSKALGGKATFFYALDARLLRVAEHGRDACSSTTARGAKAACTT